MQAITFDGFFFTPGAEDGELELSFFDYNEESLKNAEKVENTAYGDKYHIAFFKGLPDGEVVFDESFEAIFADPIVYARGFIGQNLFGTMVKKKEKTSSWFSDYLTDIKESVKLANVKS